MGVSPLWSLPFKHSHFPPNHDYGRKSNSLNSGYQWYKKKSWYGFICTLIPTFSYAGLHGFSSKPTCEIRTFEVGKYLQFPYGRPLNATKMLRAVVRDLHIVGMQKTSTDSTMNFLGGKDGNRQARTHKPSWNTISFKQSLDNNTYRLYLEWFPMVIGNDPSSQVTPFLVESVAKLALWLSNGGFGHSTVSWNTRKKVLQAHQRILETGVMYIEIWFKMLFNMCWTQAYWYHIEVLRNLTCGHIKNQNRQFLIPNFQSRSTSWWSVALYLART